MNKGYIYAAILVTVTVGLIVSGTVWPAPSAVAYAGGAALHNLSSTPEEAARTFANEIGDQAWGKAYASLLNRSQFTQSSLQHDFTGYYPSLLSYATLSSFEVLPIHATANNADVNLKLHWSTAVGISVSTQELHLIRTQDSWEPVLPFRKVQTVPPQVIPVNYLRWDVIYRGAGDDWGVQDVESPHVRIVDMHPVERADGVFLLGELLNEDVVPAYVSVAATLISTNHSPIETEDSFDQISHLLLPKQVTPFLIRFPDVHLSDVASIRMMPSSSLISASADPVIEIQNEQITPSPDAYVTGMLSNQSGQIVNVAHVLTTLYDKSGHVVWIVDNYIDQALLPQIPVPFHIHIPEDLAKNVSSQRTIVATYRFEENL